MASTETLRKIHESNVDLIKAELAARPPVLVDSYNRVAPAPLSPEEKARREEAARAASIETVHVEMPRSDHPSWRAMQERQARAIEDAKRDLAASQHVEVFTSGAEDDAEKAAAQVAPTAAVAPSATVAPSTKRTLHDALADASRLGKKE